MMMSIQMSVKEKHFFERNNKTIIIQTHLNYMIIMQL